MGRLRDGKAWLPVWALVLPCVVGCALSGPFSWPSVPVLVHPLKTKPFTVFDPAPDHHVEFVSTTEGPLPRIAVDPEAAEVWGLALPEAMQIALRNSQVFRTLDGGGVGASSATDFDPGIAELRRQAAIAAFDTLFTAAYVGSRINQPSGTFFGPGITATTRRDEGDFVASLVKPLVTGGQARISYNPPLGYLFLPKGSRGLNPLYTSNIELELRQPLLRGAGAEVNRAPIRIAGLKADQSVWDVKQSAMALVRSVEEAYWQLQATHATLKALDDLLPLMEGIVRLEEERLAAERSVKADLGKAIAQLATFRQQRIQTRTTAIQRELQLRNLLGLPPADGRTIVPTDQPAQAPLAVDPEATIRAATENRPDLMRQRLAVRIREMELLVAQNLGRPQLDLLALYRMNGLGNRLDDSLQQMVTNEFTDWTLGMNFAMPIGNRVPTANLRAAELQLQKENAFLRQNLHATSHLLSDLLRQLDAARAQYEQARKRVEGTGDWLYGARIRYEDPPPAAEGQDWLLLALNDYLLALQSQVAATRDAAAFLAEYNVVLARLEEAKGTLLASLGIDLADDPASNPAVKQLPPLTP